MAEVKDTTPDFSDTDVAAIMTQAATDIIQENPPSANLSPKPSSDGPMTDPMDIHDQDLVPNAANTAADASLITETFAVLRDFWQDLAEEQTMIKQGEIEKAEATHHKDKAKQIDQSEGGSSAASQSEHEDAIDIPDDEKSELSSDSEDDERPKSKDSDMSISQTSVDNSTKKASTWLENPENDGSVLPSPPKSTASDDEALEPQELSDAEIARLLQQEAPDSRTPEAPDEVSGQSAIANKVIDFKEQFTKALISPQLPELEACIFQAFQQEDFKPMTLKELNDTIHGIYPIPDPESAVVDIESISEVLHRFDFPTRPVVQPDGELKFKLSPRSAMNYFFDVGTLYPWDGHPALEYRSEIRWGKKTKGGHAPSFLELPVIIRKEIYHRIVRLGTDLNLEWTPNAVTPFKTEDMKFSRNKKMMAFPEQDTIVPRHLITTINGWQLRSQPTAEINRLGSILFGFKDKDPENPEHVNWHESLKQEWQNNFCGLFWNTHKFRFESPIVLEAFLRAMPYSRNAFARLTFKYDPPLYYTRVFLSAFEFLHVTSLRELDLEMDENSVMSKGDGYDNVAGMPGMNELRRLRGVKKFKCYASKNKFAKIDHAENIKTKKFLSSIEHGTTRKADQAKINQRGITRIEWLDEMADMKRTRTINMRKNLEEVRKARNKIIIDAKREARQQEKDDEEDLAERRRNKRAKEAKARADDEAKSKAERKADREAAQEERRLNKERVEAATKARIAAKKRASEEKKAADEREKKRRQKKREREKAKRDDEKAEKEAEKKANKATKLKKKIAAEQARLDKLQTKTTGEKTVAHAGPPSGTNDRTKANAKLRASLQNDPDDGLNEERGDDCENEEDTSSDDEDSEDEASKEVRRSSMLKHAALQAKHAADIKKKTAFIKDAEKKLGMMSKGKSAMKRKHVDDVSEDEVPVSKKSKVGGGTRGRGGARGGRGGGRGAKAQAGKIPAVSSSKTTSKKTQQPTSFNMRGYVNNPPKDKAEGSVKVSKKPAATTKESLAVKEPAARARRASADEDDYGDEVDEVMADVDEQRDQDGEDADDESVYSEAE